MKLFVSYTKSNILMLILDMMTDNVKGKFCVHNVEITPQGKWRPEPWMPARFYRPYLPAKTEFDHPGRPNLCSPQLAEILFQR